MTAIAVDDDEELATPPPPPQSAGSSRYVPRRPQMTHHAARAKHPPPPPDMPDDLWLMHELMILSMYHEGQGLHTLKMLRDIAWVNKAAAFLASSHEDNWPWIRQHAARPMYRYLHWWHRVGSGPPLLVD